MARVKEDHSDNEEGSITPLISLYFTLVMVCIFIVANVASTYISRRELINTTESALAQASQELDELRYYYQLPLPSYLGGSKSEMVPIDCGDAARSFYRAITSNTEIGLKSEPITILSFNCDGRILRASVQQSHKLPFSLPILPMNQFTNVAEVAVSARYL